MLQAEQQVLQEPTMAAVARGLVSLDRLLPSLAAAPPAFQLRVHALLRLGRCGLADTWFGMSLLVPTTKRTAE